MVVIPTSLFASSTRNSYSHRRCSTGKAEKTESGRLGRKAEKEKLKREEGRNVANSKACAQMESGEKILWPCLSDQLRKWEGQSAFLRAGSVRA